MKTFTHKSAPTKKEEAPKARKRVNCFMYYDHRTKTLQRRCTCSLNDQILDSTPPNGCGPQSWMKSESDNLLSGLFDKGTNQCCALHDRCFAFAADSGLCAQQFSECLAKVPNYSPFAVFKRGVLDHFVKTSSYQFLPENNYKCNPIERPKLNTMQKKAQQDVFNLQMYKPEAYYLQK